MLQESIRIIGRQGIKLVTSPRSGVQFSGATGAGIDVMAGNDDEGLQPMVRGDNMVEALSVLEERISELSALVLNFLKSQAKFNTSLTTHTHLATQAPIGIIPTAPSVTLITAGVNASLETAEAMISNFKGRMNLNVNWHTMYLTSSSAKYICSKYNKVN
jgi:hypothetical protein